MFLTKKSFIKALIMAICYFLLGSTCIALFLFFDRMDISSGDLLTMGIILYLLSIPVFFLGRYVESTGKLINLGNKLVRKKLKPAEFICHYESLRNSEGLILGKPSVEVLQLVATSYDMLGDDEKALATVDEMIFVASEKKKNLAKLFKVSYLFSYGRTEEAEELFNEVQQQKLDMMSYSLVDTILKGDRAMARGDYKTVEMNGLKLLERSVPKLDNLGKLVVHYGLGEVYEKLQDNENAMIHYQYCADFGGETAMKQSAIEKLQYLK